MGIDLGTFQVKTVSDGDTISVDRAPMPEVTPRDSLRLLSIDTEETQNPKTFGPVTEYGHEVKKLAQKWFADRGMKVQLKSDGAAKLDDFYGRALVQIFANGEHYQEYSIAQGWTPYFSKYGYSDEYHDKFVKAQQQAQKAKLGIWSDKLRNRPNEKGRPYDMLLSWWNLRANAVAQARKLKKQGKEVLMLLNGEDYQTAMKRAQEGKQTCIFGELERPSSRGSVAGQGLFVIKVKMDVPFYVYVAKDMRNRDSVVQMIEEKYLSNTSKLPDSYVKPNFALLEGKLSLYGRSGHNFPELILTSTDQLLPTV